MDELLAWADESVERNFIVRKAGTFNKTRWRVAVYEKPEGGAPRGIAGEGVGATCEVAVKSAIRAWKEQSPLSRIMNPYWYTPPLLDRRGENLV